MLFCQHCSQMLRWRRQQQLYFYERSQWKAHLCFFPGSGDLSLLAGSKNRYRTQTICSPERPGGTYVQIGLLLLNSLWFEKKIPSAFSMSQATRWFMWFLSFFHRPPGCNCSDITDQMPRHLPLRNHKSTMKDCGVEVIHWPTKKWDIVMIEKQALVLIWWLFKSVGLFQ